MAEDRPFLPYGRHLVDDDDVDAVARVLRGDFLTTGPAVGAFEEAIGREVGARFAVSCSSGTAALHLAALALDLKESDLVVVPTITFLATANAARFVGAEVAFADVDPDTGLLTGDTLSAALEAHRDRSVKAVFPVHLAGQCAPLEDIARVAEAHGIAVVEDACHAVSTAYATGDGGMAKIGACRHSQMAAFSFHPVKTIAMGEGGVVTTNDESNFERLAALRNHGMSADPERFANAELAFDPAGGTNPWYYEMEEVGYNYRASDIHCALGLSQLAKLETYVKRRRNLADRYDRLLAPLAPLVRPLTRVTGVEPAWHLYIVLIDFEAAGMSRARLMERLRSDGIGTQVHYIPVHEQPYYRRRYGAQALPGAAAYYAHALSLPMFPAMADEDVDRVVDALSDILSQAGEAAGHTVSRRAAGARRAQG